MSSAAVVVAIAALAVPALAHAERDMCRRGTKFHGAPIDLDVKDADVHDVMRLLADVGNVNIVVADTVQAKVTLHLKRVAWDLATCTIAQVHKLSVSVEDNVVLVRPRVR
jgi:type II secretory pathway component HofQ